MRRGRYTISTDKTRLDLSAIHAFLSNHAYWCLGIPRPVLEKAIANSLCFGVFEGDAQIGFTRAVTDNATFAWLCDVYVLPEHRGHGVARWMIECVLSHPDLRGMRRIVLATRDAHALYRKAGFEALPTPDRWMAIADPDVYTNATPDA
jgi:GNAT superfamily N-acetyltransferase